MIDNEKNETRKNENHFTSAAEPKKPCGFLHPIVYLSGVHR